MKTTTAKWLLQREFWEHKGAFFWTPVFLGLITSVLMFVALLNAPIDAGQLQVPGHGFAQLARHMNEKDLNFATNIIAENCVLLAAPVFMPLGFVVFFFSLFALSDERKDRSVLFWKSLPVSDNATVASKAAAGLFMAPLFVVGAAFLSSTVSLFLLLLVAGFHGMPLGGVFLQSGFYLAPLKLLALVPLYALWALPTVGWLMLVGAKSKNPFLFGVLGPILLGVLVSWFSGSLGLSDGWFWKNVVGRVLLSAFPGSWIGEISGQGVDMSVPNTLLAHSGQLLLAPSLWIGALAGMVMLYLAARVRGRSNEA